MSEAPARQVGIVLVPGFALASFAMVIEPLRVANRLAGSRLYDWSLLSAEGGDIASSAGIDLATRPIAEFAQITFDLSLVCAGFHPERFRQAVMLNWLRRHHRLGRMVGAVSTGTFILARAGLLDGHRCTVHWDYRGALAELYPALEISDDLYVIDRGIVTSGGSIAALDLMLRLIADQHSLAFSKMVSEQFVHARARGAAEHQRSDLVHRLGTARPQLIAAVKRMEETLDRALSPAELARDLGISQRQLERQFRRQLGRTPVAYHRELRLDQARRLLSQTALPVTEIALSCGFGSPSHFARLYRDRFGRLPNADRG
ncbi:AraC family transcriptional regulator with amidase-like domain [Dongia mobilis]|uniref:AraC family transcriptional regulator with amidase-like domain n=1 Tax=Dongia mobilis TaxID=578943 RepID=A0A4R6X2A9_9PROT|nr:GlxA family transcriptional regulator [Dongia mobilis]TDQ84618.1 AraC family transcriptional regulator with amidase-like domain [Dongia mobilis]